MDRLDLEPDQMTIIDGDGSYSYSSLEELDDEEECPDRALWDGIFWLEACLAVSRSVEWFQLDTIMEGVREEAFRAGILFAGGPRVSTTDAGIHGR
jgi:hypothetical protein